LLLPLLTLLPPLPPLPLLWLMLLLLDDGAALLPLTLAPCPLPLLSPLLFPLPDTGVAVAAAVADVGPFAAEGDGENMFRSRWIHALLSQPTSESRDWMDRD